MGAVVLLPLIPSPGVMAARVVVLWDKSVNSYIMFVIHSSPAISARWVIVIVSAAWVLGVGGVCVLFAARIQYIRRV
jgi:hypothetical protein